MLAYTLQVADTRTGRVYYDLPATSFSWSTKLNDVGSLRATLPIESVLPGLAAGDERRPDVSLAEFLSGPWRFTVLVRYGTQVIWAGPYTTYSRQGSESVDIGCSEIGKLLAKRVMVQPGATSAVNTTADLAVGPCSKAYLALILVAQAHAGTGSDLPIYSLNDPAQFGTELRTYYGYDLATYADTMAKLSQEGDGPDMRFDPRVLAGPDGEYLQWIVRIGNPYLAQPAPWSWDQNVAAIVGEDMDAGNMTFEVFAPGTGQQRDKVIGHASDSYLLNLGFPQLQTVDSGHSSETHQQVLDSLAAGQVGVLKRPVKAWKAQVLAEADPVLGTYRVGDQVLISVRGDPIIADGDYVKRILDLSGDDKPWVTMNLGEPVV